MVKGIVIPAIDTDPIIVRDFAGTADYQQAVGGWIEAVDVPDLGITIYVNEEGLVHHLPFNPRTTFLWWYHAPQVRSAAMLVGDAVIVGFPDREGYTTDLPDEVSAKLTSSESWGVLLGTGGAVSESVTTDWSSRVVAPLVKGDPSWFASQVEYTDYFAACSWAMILQDQWAAATDTRIVPFSEVIAARA